MSPLTIIDRADNLASLPTGPVEPLASAAFRLTTPSRHLALQDPAAT